MNTVINFLAGVGLLLIAALLEMVSLSISESCKYVGYTVIMMLEWWYICYLRDKDK